MGQRLRLTHRTVDAAGPVVAAKSKKADPYTMNQERPYDPADASKGRSYDYVPSGTPDWLEWELPRQVPELGPKEPRNEEGWAEFKDEGAPLGPMKGRGAAVKAAPVALVSKAAKCLRVAQVLLPNLPVTKLESFATALMNAQNDLVDEAYVNAEKLSTGVESKSSESSSSTASVKKAEEKQAVESASSESCSSGSKTAMDSLSSESGGLGSSTGTMPSMESKSTESMAPPATMAPAPTSTMPMASTKVTAEEAVETEAPAEENENTEITFGPVSDDPLQMVAEVEPGAAEVSPAPSDDLFSMLFTEVAPSAEPTIPDIGKSEAAAVKTASKKPANKVGIAKLASGPKVADSANSNKYLEKLWDSAPDVSNIF